MKITVSGLPGEGKTTIALLIAAALINAGIDATVEDEDVQDLGEALDNPLQPKRMQALASKEGFNIVIDTVQPPKREHVNAQCELLRRYAQAVKLDFCDRAKLVADWGEEEWEGVECAAFIRSQGPTGDMVALVESDGTIKARVHCADPDNFMDEDKFASVLTCEMERAVKRRRKLHAE